MIGYTLYIGIELFELCSHWEVRLHSLVQSLISMCKNGLAGASVKHTINFSTVAFVEAQSGRQSHVWFFSSKFLQKEKGNAIVWDTEDIPREGFENINISEAVNFITGVHAVVWLEDEVKNNTVSLIEWAVSLFWLIVEKESTDSVPSRSCSHEQQ